MKENDNHIIQRFFEFDLEEEELALFDKRMEEDLAFFEKVQLYRFVEDQVDLQFSASEKEEKGELIREWNVMQGEAIIVDGDKTGLDTAPKVAKFRWLKQVRMAAAFLLLVGIALWLFRTQDTPENLAMQYWKNTEKERLAYDRSGESQEEKNLVEADQLFHEGQYGVALDLLEGVPDDFELFAEIMLLKGQCHFELGKMDAAIQSFQGVLDVKNGGSKDMALWFQALAFLRKGEVERAKEHLNKIVKEKYPISEDAEQLLEGL